ncbi:MAG: OmpA family protein [Bacteroidota bacterium]
MQRYIIWLYCWICCTSVFSQEGPSTNNEHLLPQGAELLSQQINAPYPDARPFISPDGRQLYFIRKNHPQNIGRSSQQDIWMAQQHNDQWRRAVHIGGPINNRQDNQLIGMLPSGRTIFVVNRQPSEKTLSLHMAQRIGRSWSRPKLMAVEGLAAIDSVEFLQVNSNGNVLLLSMNAPGGFGQKDLYVSFRSTGSIWSKPQSLGPVVNTAANEISAFLSADDQTLYFSSDRSGGIGGQDIYMCKRIRDDWSNWSHAINLGTSYNSIQDDPIFSIPASGDYAYFEKISPEGSSDLYRVLLDKALRPDPIVLVKGKIVDSRGKNAISTELQIQNLSESASSNTSSLNDGHYSLLLPYGEDFKLSAEIEGYFPASQYIDLSDNWEEALDGDQQWLAKAGDGKKLPVDLANIERLQLRLNKLDKEIYQLEQQQLEAARKTAVRQQQKSGFKTYRSDPEMESLKHKYERMILGQKASKKRKFTKSDDSSSDEDLDKLYRKYNRHFSSSSRPQKESTPPPSPQGEQEVLPAPTYATSELPTFYKLEEQMRQELEEELRNPIKLQLIDESFNRMALDFERNLSSEYRPLFSFRLRNQTLSSLKKKMIPEGTNKPERIRKSTNRTSGSVENVTTNLRNKLYEDVYTALREELYGEVQKAIQRELDYSLKKAIKNRLVKELNVQIQSRQKKAEPLKKSENAIGARTTDADEDAPRTYKEIERDILLFPLRAGSNIPLNNVFFEANLPQLLPRSYPELDKVADILNRYPEMIVEIGGHTNGLVSYSFAHLLSTQRAETVVAYLAQKGVDTSRILSKGYGSTLPLASNNSPEGQRKNQRIELKIIEY